jgi:uncharacterized protein (DUF1800 family)
MNRRSFLAGWKQSYRTENTPSPSAPRPASSGLEPYLPDSSQPWDAVRAGHLLRRTTFLPRWSDVAAVLALTPSAAVDLLLDTPSLPAPPSCADHATEDLAGLDTSLQEAVKAAWANDATILRNWCTDLMTKSGLTIVEKMTLFWSGHFTSEFQFEQEDYTVAPLLYRQNKIFREGGLGSFRDLVMKITLDGAMLVYLGGDLNSAGKPNENYGRELMELFTMGRGNYTEGDVKEAARILTGWRAQRYDTQQAPNGPFNSYLDAGAHDIGAKEYLGVSFPARDASTNTEFLVRRDEVQKLVDTIFEKRGDAVARFICRKIYHFFVYSNPGIEDQGVIAAMADIFIRNNFQIRPVMAALLKSAHFFDNANIGAQIKTPAEFEVGLARQFGAAPPIALEMNEIGQTLFDPPNVSGWPGWHDWITTTTYPIRATIAGRIVNGLDESTLLAFIKQFPNYTDVSDLTKNLSALLLPRPLSAERQDSLEKKLTSGAPGYEWPNIINGSPSTAARNLRDMLTTIVQLPDFQLC